MIKTYFKILVLIFFFLGFLFSQSFYVSTVSADEESDRLRELEQMISDYENKITEAQSKQKTLASTITVLNNQIYLTEANIDKTKADVVAINDELELLSKKIENLDDKLVKTTILLKNRIQETYKRSFMPSLMIIFSSRDFSSFFSKIKYIEAAQEKDRELMYEMEESKINFDKQKEIKKAKQKELEELEEYLENQTIVLQQQRLNKESLLSITKNDETKFQQLLSQAKNEYESIQAIISHRGSEGEGIEVKKGEAIASIISGSSCNSSGSHLHFTVVENGNTINPFSKLKPIDYDNCSGPGSCSVGDPFNPSGDWDWPIASKIIFTQGYGSTWAVNNTWAGSIYSFHNGIDIKSTSGNTVKAVADGTLYRGSYSGSGGCRLRYVRLAHKDSNIESFYLHVNY